MFRTNRIIRYINQNRRKILVIIGVIAGIIILIQLLNSMAKNSSNNKLKTSINDTIDKNVYKPNKTVISGEDIEEKKSTTNEEVIEEFVKNCKQGNIQSAYEMLTDECKQNLFPTMEKFNEYYCKKIFADRNDYNIQSWIFDGEIYTYKIRYTIDFLKTGNANVDSYEDYITIIDNNGDYRININSYVGRKEINKKVSRNDIVYNVKYKDIYMDREEYWINVKNNTYNDILLDTLEKTDTIKLVNSSKKVEYQAYTNELSLYDVTIPLQNSKTIRIKFAKDYNPERNATEIIFSDILLNKEKYKENSEDETYKDNIDIDF